MAEKQTSPLTPFTTDGCSGPRCLWRVLNIVLFGSLGWHPPFEWACNIHDIRYHAGGTEIDKAIADRELRIRVVSVLQARGHRYIARPFGFLTELGVNLFGGPDRDTTYRWNYGHPFGERRYQPLTLREFVERDLLIEHWLNDLAGAIIYTGGDPMTEQRKSP